MTNRGENLRKSKNTYKFSENSTNNMIKCWRNKLNKLNSLSSI